MIRTSRPVFIHSDVVRGLITTKRAGYKIHPRDAPAALLAFCAKRAGSAEDDIILPAFNYDYGSSRLFDVDNDPVQVGALPEWARTKDAFTRSEIPIFSVLSKKDLGLTRASQINPFGSSSVFNWLVMNDATLVLLGVPLACLTFIHYVEEMSGGPLYRYTKPFPGTIRKAGKDRVCEMSMHVRPMGLYFNYDWHRLEADLIRNDILIADQEAPGFLTIRARKLMDYWGNRLSEDPLYLLDPQSRETFALATEGGTRRVQLEEYENGGK